MNQSNLFERKGLSFSLVVFVMLAGLLLAGCQFPGAAGSLPDDGPPIPVSPEAARRFAEKLADAQSAIDAGNPATLTVTEEEATSFVDLGSQVAREMEERGVETLEDAERIEGTQLPEGAQDLPEWLRDLRQDGDVPNLRIPDLAFWLTITEPQIHFKDNGQVVLRGAIEIANEQQPLRMVMVPQVTDGRLDLDFVEGQIGPLPVPEWLVDSFTQGLADLLLASQDYVEVSAVQVDEGTLTVSGRGTSGS